MPRFERNISRTSTLEACEVTEAHREIAEKLSERHGNVRLAREDSGIHCYFSSPKCLDEYGLSELHKMHGAVNLTKYLAGEDLAAMCMKTGKAYRVSTLLKFPTLEQRGIQAKRSVTTSTVNPDYLEPDANGVMVPKRPGICVPVTGLPAEHPAMVYLKERRFDAQRLWEQFRLSYCEEENHELSWAPLPGGAKATPQGRLIFFIDVNGVQVGWQARVLELTRKHAKYYWHPYDKKWTATHQRESKDAEWMPLPGYERWDPRKYLLGYGTSRNKCLMGYDAAVKFNRGRQSKYCILAEGALDVGRFGPPGVAALGKHLSQEQADLLSEFDHILFVGDNDKAGHEMRARVTKLLGATESGAQRYGRLVMCELPADVKDAGDLEQAKADELLAGWLKEAGELNDKETSGT